MSKETEPVRSRRQLRAQTAQATGAAAKPQVPLGSAPKEAPKEPAAPTALVESAPAPSTPPVPAPRPEPANQRGERQSQTRARDRAALRAYKELVDTPGPSPLPSRRALRQAQLDAERAPVTAVNPVVSAIVPAVPSNAPKTQSAPQIETATASQDTVAAPLPSASPRARVGRRAAAVGAGRGSAVRPPVAAADDSSTPEPTLAATAEVTAVAGQAGEENGSLAHTSESPATSSATGEVLVEGTDPVSGESAKYPPLPGLMPGGSYYPVSAGPPPVAVAPSTEELRLLAAQRAEAERAAILAERAQARERLAQESAKNRRPSTDPTATNNLAMVTPLDFIEVPGTDRPVLRQPTTTHVPIVATAAIRGASKRSGGAPKRTETPKLPPAPTAATPIQATQPAVPTVRAERFDAALAARSVHRPGLGNRPLTGGRSSTLKQAEAMATGGHATVRTEAEAVSVQRSQMPPMPADYAHGLEPLDAMTAGLARTQRNMLIQWGSIIAGGAALVVGVIMFITSLAR
ncbi:hypothetical protein [Arthrobacter sp. TWP1-1]|uniref:hypothetical protein n=1 Tax=Arthrobacter sp. TWP1-1 TaxID=2804568 RepID=UPI003CE9A1BB